ncbi:hypothetical protein TNCV_4657561 [Trichonephila clavipes]|nr:hypothetical protein TNCV_4657561 [Trichonephila clavipes]
MALGWRDVTPHPYDVMPFSGSPNFAGRDHRAVERAVWTKRFAGSNLCERPSRACNENAVKGWYKTDLTYLYDELEGKLRASESLGRNHEKYGYFLIPLVESCLPKKRY